MRGCPSHPVSPAVRVLGIPRTGDPDATRIAWVGNTERNFGIHATNVTSGRTVRLTRHEGDHAPDWR